VGFKGCLLRRRVVGFKGGSVPVHPEATAVELSDEACSCSLQQLPREVAVRVTTVLLAGGVVSGVQ
jgi:hypothetical protein